MKKFNILVLVTTVLALSSCISTPVDTSINNVASEKTVNAEDIEKTEKSETKLIEKENEENLEKQEKDTEQLKAAKEKENKKEKENLFIDSISNVTIKILNAPKQATVGNEFVRPFTIYAERTDGENKVPAADFPITIKYPSSRVDGELVYTTENVKTDARGIYEFTAPRTSFSAATDFTVYPTYTGTNNTEKQAEISEEVKNAIADKSVMTPWLVRSDLATRGGILVVWEFNERGRFTENSAELLSEIRSRGIYNVGNAPYCDSSYIGKPVSTIYKENNELLRDSGVYYGYMIYGTIKFSKNVTPNEDGSYSCGLIADIQAIEMRDGSVALHKTFEQEATGKGWNDVVGKCKSKLVSKITDSLLFEM